MRLRHIRFGLAFCTLAVAGALTAAALASPATTCRAGSTAAACLKAGQTCTTSNQAAYKKAGYTCVAGRLQKIKTTTPASTTTTTPATTTTTPSRPLAGSYAGTTTQGHPVSFVVQTDQKNLRNLVGGAVDEICTPSHAWTFDGFDTGGDFDYGISVNYFRLPDGAGTTAITNGIASRTAITFTATFAGTQATGTYAVTTHFTDAGVDYTCTASVNFTATHS